LINVRNVLVSYVEWRKTSLIRKVWIG